MITTTPPDTREDLPRRPRLLPGLAVLWRSPATAQLGIDPARAAVVQGLTAPQARLLRDLDGHHTVEELTADDTTGEITELLALLAGRGLLEDATPPPGPGEWALSPHLAPELVGWSLGTGRPARGAITDRADTAVVVQGNGRLTVAVATALATAGIGRVHVLTTGAVRPEDTGTGYRDADVGRARDEAAMDAVSRAAPDVLASRTPPQHGPDLTILADAVVPDPTRVSRLTRDGHPHLAVRVRDGTGMVGPVVLPGRSSCLRCADLHRADRDRGWPTMAAQLAGHTQHADIASTLMTTGLAVAQALLILGWPDTDTKPPPTYNGTLELDPVRGTILRRTWPPHPSCPCRRDKRKH
ncbi:TOMM precursor leader peptide-binding protein [Longimycelium tulufanense]|nr:TOMM precursor leader peptide-binding protein [Longimycelium tulufanense]